MAVPITSHASSSILSPIVDADLAYTKRLPFSVICDMFSMIASTNKRGIKRAALEKLLNKYRLFYIYPIMRLILPHLDRARQTYALKELKLAKVIIQILAIAKDSADALRMVNWRQPQRNAVTGKHEGGDFAEAVYNSLKSRCVSHSMSTVASVNAHLDELNATQDVGAKNQILTMLLREATAYEMKWIVRIILKDLKIGISEALVLEVFHEDATELYNITSSLFLVCNQLRDPTVRTSHQSISLFHPIKPMLACRKQPKDIGSLISDGNRKFVIEQKFDGERVQVHKDGHVVRLFSRNSLEITDIYSMIQADLYRHIKAKQAIIDGELLLWDRETNIFESFGRAKTQAVVEKGLVLSSTVDENRDNKQLCFVAFDVLLLEGEGKMHLPLRSRIDLLHKYIEVKDKVVEIVEQTEAKSEQSVIEALNRAIDSRHEGIMVKDLNSIYVPNERRDKWTKLKPEYMDGIGDTLDLLIIGGMYGSGVCKGASISHFLLGVQKSPGVYWSVARVGSGYYDAELRTLQTTLQNYWRPYNPANPPKCMQLADTGIKDVPNVWIEPKYSRILEVLAEQVTPSEKYRAGYTLRFPKVKCVRLDKVADQVTTMDELLEMVSHYESRAVRTKISAQQANKETTGGGGKASKGKKDQKSGIFSTHALTGLAMAKLDEHPDKDIINGIFSKIFIGMELCIINGDGIYRKEFLETVIKNQGGTIAQAPTTKTYCAIAGKYSVKVKLIEEKKGTNIVWLKWLIGSVQRGTLLPLEPRFMIYTEPSTADQFKNEIDEYGDTFERLTDESTLREVFERIQVPWLASKRQTPWSTPASSSRNGTPRKQEPHRTNLPQLTHIKPYPNRTEISSSSVDSENQQNQGVIVDLDHLPDLVSAEKKLFECPWWALFRSCTVYLDIFTTISTKPRTMKKRRSEPSTDPNRVVKDPKLLAGIDPGRLEYSSLCLIAPQLRFYGATIVDHLDITTPLHYIIVDSTDSRRFAELECFVQQFEIYGPKPIIADERWANICIAKKVRLNPSEMLLPEGADPFEDNDSATDEEFMATL
jgi:DNA ligase-4